MQVNEELYEVDLEKELNNIIQKHLWYKIKRLLYHIYLTLVVYIKKWFSIITVKEIYSGLIFILPILNIEKSLDTNSYAHFQRKLKKCIPKVKKLIKKYKITSVVISENLQKNEEFMKKFLQTDIKEDKIHILNGKSLLPYLIKEIFDYIIQLKGKNIELEDLYILVEKDCTDYKENIIFLSQYFKTINIVTPNIKSYQKFANQLEESKNVMVTVTNNTKKSLRKSKWIVNFDIPIEKMNKYIIYRNSAILYLEENEAYEKNAFDGICIYNAEIDVSQQVKDAFLKQHLLEQCPITVLYESTIIKKRSITSIKEQMKKDEVIVKKLYGKRGILPKEEYKKVG